MKHSSAWWLPVAFAAGLTMGWLLSDRTVGPQASGKRSLGAPEASDSTSPAVPLTQADRRSAEPAALNEAQLLWIAKEPRAKQRADALRRAGTLAAATHDQPALLRLLQALRDVGDRNEFASGVVEGLGTLSAARALAFAEALPASPFRAEVIIEALENQTVSSPREALDNAARLLRGNDYNNALMSITDTWSRSAPADALQWALHDAQPERQQQAIEVIGAQWGHSDPAKGIQELMSSVSGENLAIGVSAVLGTWSQTDPAAAYQWAVAHHTELGSTQPLAVALLNWGSSDPPSAAAALLQQTDGQLLRRVGPTLATFWAGQAPADAMTFAQAIPQPDARQATVHATMSAWAEYAPQEALASALNLAADNPDRAAAVHGALSAALANSPGGFKGLQQSLPPQFQQEIGAMEANFRADRPEE